MPEVTEDTFRFGTESAAAILLDAAAQLEMHSPKADDNIQLIRPNLTEAVDACVRTLGWVVGPAATQQSLDKPLTLCG